MEITVKHEYTPAQLPVLSTFLSAMGPLLGASDAPPSPAAVEGSAVHVAAEHVASGNVVDMPKRTRRTKAEMEADRAAEAPKAVETPVAAVMTAVAAAVVETAPAAPAVAPTTSALTQADAMKALEGLLAKPGKGMPACLAVLGQYGVTSISKLPADKYGEFIQKCNESGEAV